VGPVLLMSAPDHFTVSYAINPWMHPNEWHAHAARFKAEAQEGWLRLAGTYRALGARVEVMQAVDGLPDLVFTANSAVVLDGTALLARFRFPERQGEEAVNLAFFEDLKRRGLIERIATPADGIFFEGAGDAIWDASRQMFWAGYGPRSTADAPALLELVYGKKAVALELIDPRFYHLDTCFSVLPGGEILYYPAAFTEQGRAQIRGLTAPVQMIEAEEADATTLAVNCCSVGNADIVFGNCSEALEARLTARGYRVHRAPLGSFCKSGGSAFCLTLRLDARSKP